MRLRVFSPLRHRFSTRRVAPVLTLALALASPALPAAVEDAAGRIVSLAVPAPALEGNLLGTATVQEAAVYLPPGYDDEAERRYPSIYLLHGIFDHHDVWLDAFGVPGILDRLIAGGELPPVIAVMADGFNRLGGGFYRDSPVSGGWGTFVAEDLVGFVDARFRTVPAAGGRAVAGHSMGGYGALHLGMTRPDVFSVVWAMSPCCLAAIDDIGFGNEAWKTAARFTDPGDLPAALERGDFYAVATVGWLAAISPDPGNPPFFVDFPFELVRGEIVLDDAEYDRYLDALPVRAVGDRREALRGLRGLAMDVGLGDQFLHIPRGTLELSHRLGEQRIPHRLDVYAGDHRQEVARRLEEVVLPWLARKLGERDYSPMP